MKILMVLTSHDQLGNTGRKTGFWLEEFAAPYFVFRDAGAELTPASSKGGQPFAVYSSPAARRRPARTATDAAPPTLVFPSSSSFSTGKLPQASPRACP